MKIRTGFVANSSSSSFIIQCSKIPKTHGEARKIWFGEKDKWVPEIISEHLFKNLKPFELDFKKIEELLEKYTYLDLETDARIPIDNEFLFIMEIHSDFWYDEKYERNSEKSNLDDFICEKLNIDFESIEFRNIPWEQIKHFEKEYFSLNKVNEKFKTIIKSIWRELNYSYPKIENPVFMKTEISDDSEIGAEIEYNTCLWEKFPSFIKFNHH